MIRYQYGRTKAGRAVHLTPLVGGWPWALCGRHLTRGSPVARAGYLGDVYCMECSRRAEADRPGQPEIAHTVQDVDPLDTESADPTNT